MVRMAERAPDRVKLNDLVVLRFIICVPDMVVAGEAESPMRPNMLEAEFKVFVPKVMTKALEGLDRDRMLVNVEMLLVNVAAPTDVIAAATAVATVEKLV